MKIEQQVCTLEQAKRLKVLGINQDSLFSWFGDEERRLMDSGKDGISYGGWVYLSTTTPANGEDADHRQDTETTKPISAAFTVAELGVMLPDDFVTALTFPPEWSNYRNGKYLVTLTMWKYCKKGHNPYSEDGFGIQYRCNDNINQGIPQYNPINAATEVAARAEMLIYLIENNLMKVEEVNQRLAA